MTRTGRLLTPFVLALLTGCGGAQSHTTTGRSPTASKPPAARKPPALRPYGPLLVYFKRVQGVDPLSSYLIVHTNGTAVAVVTNGGVGGGGLPSSGEGEIKHTFVLPSELLTRLQNMLHRTRLRTTGCCNVNEYIYWVTAGNRVARLQQGAVPRDEQSLIRTLNAITDAHTMY